MPFDGSSFEPERGARPNRPFTYADLWLLWFRIYSDAWIVVLGGK